VLTFERSGPLTTINARGEYYYSFISQGVHYDGQMCDILDVLAKQVGTRLLFRERDGDLLC
jgi:glycerophosphoryl diester phosphodiesterase